MLKKLIILNIIFILLFSSAVYAITSTADNKTTIPVSGNTQTIPDPIDTKPDFTSKDYITEDNINDLLLVAFLRPDDFTKTFETNKDAFFFSCKTQTENLVIKLLLFDEEKDTYVPLEKEIIEGETNERTIVNTSWKFGLSGYLFCSFRMPSEGTYEYRLLIYDADLENEELILGDNLQILDFTVNYKKTVSFESILENSFWDIYFNSYNYALPLLP
jgi:hypothetical protein